MSWLFLSLACGGEPAADPEPVAEPAPEATGGSQLEPARVCDHSACGTVTDADGAPVKDAWIQVVRSDDEVDEPSTLGAEGGWVLHMREENVGPRPARWMPSMGIVSSSSMRPDRYATSSGPWGAQQ
ncbi:MAG: carboxypeptidase regulatory-like domain-containing protein [Proteobacteria bacterium]|nr:carboxypeptidase regulatory-like domain-containing protein [Pseudomonadota bacterium]MCP4922173.1 carboxypeptidase regulatory-like domain-containing protein [Pseudomonadota bacterium]